LLVLVRINNKLWTDSFGNCCLSAVEDSSADVSAAAENFQSLSLHNDELAAKKTAEDNPAVIIPDHLQVTNT
jgi:hypothetical protein